MTKVSGEQIRRKLESFAYLLQALKTGRENSGGKLPRHDWWRYQYYEFPYLAGAATEKVSSRFRDVFMNLSDLTSEGKITIRPGATDDSSLMPKFTHLLEEWNSRGGVPVDVISNARAPILRYFENGDPIAVKLFQNFKPLTSPFLVKYSKKEFLEPMLKKGIVRICPANFYADAKHIDSIRDDETHRYFFIPTFRERLQGKTSFKFQGHDIYFGDDDIEIPVVVPDYFMYSLCDHIYYRLPTDFDADAALIIRDPNLFTQRVVSTFLAAHPEWHPLTGNVTYYDPYRDYTKIPVPEMAKHFGYSYQREYRIAFRCKSHIDFDLESEFINIGHMIDYAELIAL